MVSREEATRRIVRLVSELEESRAFVTVEDVCRVASEGGVLGGGLAEIGALVRAEVKQGVLLTDARLVLDRESGEYREAELVRVNWQHPSVREAGG